MDYFLIAREGWGIPAERFSQLLVSRWPGVKLKPVVNPKDNRGIEFELPMKESVVEGALDREGSSIIFYGAIRDCAEFALWYQATIPEARPLLLCDEGYNRSIPLQPDTTAADIVRAFCDVEPS